MDKIPLNIGLISNPLNWVIIWFMVAIGGLAIAVIYPRLSNKE